jgi:hypothetical protein
MQWVPGTFSLGVKWLGHEADNSPPCSAKVKNAWICISTSPIHIHSMVLNEAQDMSSWHGTLLSKGKTLLYPYFSVNFQELEVINRSVTSRVNSIILLLLIATVVFSFCMKCIRVLGDSFEDYSYSELMSALYKILI